MIMPCDAFGQLSPIITDSTQPRAERGAAPANWSWVVYKGVPNRTGVRRWEGVMVPESRDNRRKIQPLFGETWKLPRAPRFSKWNKPAGDRHQRAWTECREKKLELKNGIKILQKSYPSLQRSFSNLLRCKICPHEDFGKNPPCLATCTQGSVKQIFVVNESSLQAAIKYDLELPLEM